MIGRRSALAFVNARVLTPHGVAARVRFDARVLELDGPVRPGDRVIDLDGRWVLPGLINAHDHLELNHYGVLAGRPPYGHAGAWIDDLRPLVRHDPRVREGRAVPLRDRLFLGALKNLLAGATTVAHHNPLYRAFGWRFPVQVLRRFGWAHSLGMEDGPVGAHGEPGGVVAERSAATPADVPFIVHAAEGVDDTAAAELERLERTGCLRANTVLVHGLAIGADRWRTLFARGVALVWCPVSNVRLFGRTVPMPELLAGAHARHRVCLGTDSRLTGSRDLLDEARAARDAGVTAGDILDMVTTTAADVLRMDDAGRIRPGASADFVVLPAGARDAGEALAACARRNLDLVVRRGRPVLGDPSFAAAFTGAGGRGVGITLDDRALLMRADLARRVGRCPLREPGLVVLG